MYNTFDYARSDIWSFTFGRIEEDTITTETSEEPE